MDLDFVSEEEQAWSIKDLLYALKHQKMIFDLAGPSDKIPIGQYRSILPARVANHSVRFGSSCPLTELVIIITLIIWLCLTRTGNYKIHEFDWLKSILTAV